MLMDFQKHTVSAVEYILMGWVTVLILEEIRQVSRGYVNLLLLSVSLNENVHLSSLS